MDIECEDYVGSESSIDQSATYRDRLISRNIYTEAELQGGSPREEPINNAASAGIVIT